MDNNNNTPTTPTPPVEPVAPSAPPTIPPVENTPSSNLNSSPIQHDSSTPPKKRSPLPIILALVILLIVVIGGVWWFMSRQEPAPVAPPAPEESQETITPTDTSLVQTGVAAWLAGMQTTPGIFNQMETCEGPESCLMQNPIQDIISMWAWYQAAAAQNDTEAITQIQQNMSQLTLTPQPWACRSLYSLGMTNNFTPEAVQSMQAYCQAQGSAPTEAYTQDEILTQMQNIINNESSSSASIFQTQNVPEMFTQAAVQASDNAVNGLWNGTGNEAALSSFGQALTLYQADTEMMGENSPLLGIAALDMYFLTETAAYLDFSEFLFNNYVPQSCNSLAQCANMIYFAQALYSATGSDQYMQLENVLAHSVITSSFDGTGGKAALGKNAFYTGDGTTTIYPTRENALLLGTFAQN